MLFRSDIASSGAQSGNPRLVRGHQHAYPPTHFPKLARLIIATGPVRPLFTIMVLGTALAYRGYNVAAPTLHTPMTRTNMGPGTNTYLAIIVSLLFVSGLILLVRLLWRGK